jgi:hypothetical protein
MFDTVPDAWLAEYSQAMHPSQLRPAGWQPPATAAHYVTSAEGAHIQLLVGPFPTDYEATLWLDTAQDVLLGRGQVEAALNIRVTRLVNKPMGARSGELNSLLGVRVH